MYLKLQDLLPRDYGERNQEKEKILVKEYHNRLKAVGYPFTETNKSAVEKVIECFAILSVHIRSASDCKKYKEYRGQFRQTSEGTFYIAKTLNPVPPDFKLVPEPEYLPPPKKGLLLYGNTGTGKSFLLKTLSSQADGLAVPMRYESAWNITKRYMKSHPDSEDEKVGYDYLDWFFKEHRTENIVIDDIGAGGTAKRYGNNDITPMIFMERYENFLAGKLTFFTSNLGSTEELKAEYGDRVLSRLFEMCYFVPFIGKDNRRLN